MRFPKPLRMLLVALAASVVAPIVVTSSTASAEGIAIVYVDTDHVETEVDEGRAANDVLIAFHEKLEKEAAAYQVKLNKMQDDLQKQSKTLSKDALEKQFAAYQQAAAEVQDQLMKFERDVNEKERSLFQPIEKRVVELIRIVANRDGYALVLSKRSVPYGRPDLDITDKIIQEYNKKYPSAAGKKPASSTTAPAPKASASTAPKMP